MSDSIRSALLTHIDERCDALEEELREAREVGVKTSGFDQILGALDEMQMLRSEIIETIWPRPRAKP